MDAAAGGRLYQPRGIADDHYAIAEGAVDRAERQDLLARRHVGIDDAPPLTDALDHPRVARQHIARRHHPDADGRAVGTLHRHGPGETARRNVLAEVQLDLRETAGAKLPLSCMQIRAWQAESEAG